MSDPVVKGVFNYHNIFTDKVLPYIGLVIFVIFLPFLFIQAIITVLWDKANILNPVVEWLFNIKYFQTFVKHPIDGMLIPLTLHLGIVLPCVMVWFSRYGFCWRVALLYNVIRIGPMYKHFAYVYAMCHKEVHTYGDIFNTESFVASNIYNYWIGLFHGILPGTFTDSHLLNHHKYNNNVQDVYSTAGYRRDHVMSYMRYIVVWLFYSSNLSTLYELFLRRKLKTLLKVLIGTLYYISFTYICVRLFGTGFTLMAIIYPFFEGNILLSLVNFTWHMFIDDNNNQFVRSTTILNGRNFIFCEEYHVVHHQQPGYHYSRYKHVFEKHKKKYNIIFENVNIFELGITAILGNYTKLSNMVKNRKANTASVIKTRLRHTLW